MSVLLRAARIGAFVAPLAVLLFLNVSWFVFVIGILISVVLHELGHFLTAKWTGMKPTEMFVGFGPKLFSVKRGETEYGVKALPLGAYVRITGMYSNEEIDPEDEPRAYRNKSLPKRLLVISAGSIMHVIIAFVLLFGVNLSQGKQVETDGVFISGVVESSVAETAGVVAGDVVVSFAGQTTSRVEDLTSAVQNVNPEGGLVPLEVVRDGTTVTVEAEFVPTDTDVRFGVLLNQNFELVSSNPIEATTATISEMGFILKSSAEGISKVVQPVNIWGHVTGQRTDLETRPATIVGVTGISDDVVEASGWVGMLVLLAALNLFIGFLNMVPLPPLDGGHFMVAVYESVRAKIEGKPRYFVNPENVSRFALVVIVLLMTVFAAGLYLDIFDPISTG